MLPDRVQFRLQLCQFQLLCRQFGPQRRQFVSTGGVGSIQFRLQLCQFPVFGCQFGLQGRYCFGVSGRLRRQCRHLCAVFVRQRLQIGHIILPVPTYDATQIDGARVAERDHQFALVVDLDGGNADTVFALYGRQKLL